MKFRELYILSAAMHYCIEIDDPEGHRSPRNDAEGEQKLMDLMNAEVVSLRPCLDGTGNDTMPALEVKLRV